MYTQCPECRAAFRVTANDLKQAAGKVRCGGCGRAFDALEFLSEEMPAEQTGADSGPELPELKPDVPGKRRPKIISPEDSIALLKTLDQLAGADIRLEDTGIEWRVLDDQAIASLETKDEQPAGEANGVKVNAPHDDEQRYDDDTPMDEEPSESDADAAALQSDDEFAADEDETSAAAGEPDVNFDDDESGEWEEILEEFDGHDVADEAHAVGEQGDVDPLTETIVQESAGEEDEAPPVDDIDGNEGDADPADGDADEETPADEVTDEARADDGDDEAFADDESHADDSDGELHAAGDVDKETQQDDAARTDASSAEAQGDEHDDSYRTAANDDSKAAGEGEPDDAPTPEVQEGDVSFESIILEGDTVRSALDTDIDAAPVEIPPPWAPPEESARPHRSTGARVGMSLGVILLLIILGLQAVHQNRTTLATVPALRDAIAPLYRAAGLPLVPTWDVRGWRFEATQGNTDADQLIVYSRLGNTSGEALPYPLIGVSLTDRFEETVGGVLLEPSEYLAGNQNPLDPVGPGDTFDAVITLKSPDPAATGYRLRACYRAARGKLRCAVGDFRE